MCDDVTPQEKEITAKYYRIIIAGTDIMQKYLAVHGTDILTLPEC